MKAGAKVTLSNGTIFKARHGRCITRLPNGSILRASPNENSPEMAERLGYGADVSRMTEDHDALHSSVCDLLGLPYSLSLMQAAGQLPDYLADLAKEEESLILRLQALGNSARLYLTKEGA